MRTQFCRHATLLRGTCGVTIKTTQLLKRTADPRLFWRQDDELLKDLLCRVQVANQFDNPLTLKKPIELANPNYDLLFLINLVILVIRSTSGQFVHLQAMLSRASQSEGLLIHPFLIQFAYPPIELLTPLNLLFLPGDLPTCERLFQELLHCKAYAALLTCVPLLASEAMKLITAVIKLADGQPLDLDVQTRKKPSNSLWESFKAWRNQGGGQGGGVECSKAGGKKQSK
jgi:hypothetical protein